MAGDESLRKIGEIAARVESTIELGDFFAGSRELHDAVEQYPDAVEVAPDPREIIARSTDRRMYPAAHCDLRGCPGRAPSEAMRILALLEAATALGDREGRGLAVRGPWSAEDVESGAVPHRDEVRREIRNSTFRSAMPAGVSAGTGHLTFALHALELISSRASEPEIDEWRTEILDNIAASSSGALGLCLWALAQGDEELFAAALEIVARTDKSATIDLIEDAFGAGMQRAMAASVPVAVGLGRLGPELAERRAALVRAALDNARTLFSEGDFARAHDLARPIAADLAGVQKSSGADVAACRRSAAAHSRAGCAIAR